MKAAISVALALYLLLYFVHPGLAQEVPPPDTPANRRTCVGNARACGMTVPISPTLAGPRNSPVCLTARIVHLPTVASDYIGVCRDGAGLAVPDGLDEDGNPVCAPFPPGRLPPDWRQTTLPTGGVGMNPDPQGLTGLESWFWYEGDDTHSWPSPVHEGRTADCRILPAPAPVTYSAAITAYEYTIGDSRPAKASASSAGDVDSPAARHVYRTKGTWQVGLTCTWSGAPATPMTIDCAEKTVPVISVTGQLIH